MVEYQWGIFWADLNPVRGSEQKGNRPVLVISAEEVNQALPIAAVLPLTSVKSGRKIYPTEALLPAAETGLPKDSIAMAHQIRTVSRERLGEKCGHIAAGELREKIKTALKKYLDF